MTESKIANSGEIRDTNTNATGAMKSSILGFHLEYVNGIASTVEIDL